jgi:hypothetical protein
MVRGHLGNIDGAACSSRHAVAAEGVLVGGGGGDRRIRLTQLDVAAPTRLLHSTTHLLACWGWGGGERGGSVRDVDGSGGGGEMRTGRCMVACVVAVMEGGGGQGGCDVWPDAHQL